MRFFCCQVYMHHRKIESEKHRLPEMGSSRLLDDTMPLIMDKCKSKIEGFSIKIISFI